MRLVICEKSPIERFDATALMSGLPYGRVKPR